MFFVVLIYTPVFGLAARLSCEAPDLGNDWMDGIVANNSNKRLIIIAVVFSMLRTEQKHTFAQSC